jgi:hypothetical protein
MRDVVIDEHIYILEIMKLSHYAALSRQSVVLGTKGSRSLDFILWGKGVVRGFQLRERNIFHEGSNSPISRNKTDAALTLTIKIMLLTK